MANQILAATIIEEYNDSVGEVVHCHFDECPACKTDYAGTSIYGEAREELYHAEPYDEAFYCQECGQLFLLLEFNADDGVAKVELLDRLRVDPKNPPSIFHNLTYDRTKHYQQLNECGFE